MSWHTHTFDFTDASDANWRKPLQWAKAARARWRDDCEAAPVADRPLDIATEMPTAYRPRVLCAPDVFEDREDLRHPRLRLLHLIQETPELDWLLLTKRPDVAATYESWFAHERPNVWLGTSVATQEDADRNIPALLHIPAAVRFVALTLTEAVDLTNLQYRDGRGWKNAFTGRTMIVNGGVQGPRDGRGIDWVTVEGETGPGARPCDVAWVRSIVEQCKPAGVACWVERLGSDIRDRNDAGFDGEPDDAWGDPGYTVDVEHSPNGWREHYQGAPVRVRLGHPQGADPAEWPADLRVREVPKR